MCSPLAYCLVCVLQPCVHLLGKGAKAGVAGPAGAACAGPTFLAEYAIHRVPLSRFAFFSLSLPLILFILEEIMRKDVKRLLARMTLCY